MWRLWRLADEPFGVRPVCVGEHGCWDAAPARPPGTNVGGAFGLLAEMVATGTSGSVVTMICDSGERYGAPCWHPDVLRDFEQSCRWPAPADGSAG